MPIWAVQPHRLGWRPGIHPSFPSLPFPFFFFSFLFSLYYYLNPVPPRGWMATKPSSASTLQIYSYKVLTSKLGVRGFPLSNHYMGHIKKVYDINNNNRHIIRHSLFKQVQQPANFRSSYRQRYALELDASTVLSSFAMPLVPLSDPNGRKLKAGNLWNKMKDKPPILDDTLQMPEDWNILSDYLDILPSSFKRGNSPAWAELLKAMVDFLLWNSQTAVFRGSFHLETIFKQHI